MKPFSGISLAPIVPHSGSHCFPSLLARGSSGSGTLSSSAPSLLTRAEQDSGDDSGHPADQGQQVVSRMGPQPLSRTAAGGRRMQTTMRQNPIVTPPYAVPPARFRRMSRTDDLKSCFDSRRSGIIRWLRCRWDEFRCISAPEKDFAQGVRCSSTSGRTEQPKD